MTTVADILDFLFTLAPEHLKEEWDTVGLFCGHSGRSVTRVLVALDASEQAIQEAASMGAELLVTHHPLIFHATKNISDQTDLGRRVLTLAERGVAVISMHTNLDSAVGGVNDCLANALGLSDTRVLHPGAESGCGLGRVGVVAPQPLTDFLRQVRQALALPALRYCDGGRQVAQVAVGGGACADFIDEAAALGCDTFVTSDVKYHEFQQAQALGLNLIDAGHYGTENPVCAYLQSSLRQKFPALRVELSQAHRDIVQYA